MAVRPLHATAAVLLTAVLGAAGCGSSNAGTGDSSQDFKQGSEERAVAAAVENFAQDAKNRKYGDICDDDLAAATAKKLATLTKGDDCAARLKRSLRDVDQFELTVPKGGVTISGTGAIAAVKLSGTASRTVKDAFQLVKERDDWRIAAIGVGG